MIQQKRKTYCVIFAIVIVLFALSCCTPRLGFSIYLVPPAFLSIFLVLKGYSTPSRYKKYSLLMSVLLYFALVIFYKVFGISSASPGELFQHLVFFMFVMLMPLIAEINEQKQVKIAFWIALFVLMFNICYNIFLSIIMPEINLLASQYFDEGFLTSINAGKSVFYSMSLFAFNVVFFAFLQSEGRFRKLMLLCSIIIAVYILAFCNKATVVVYLLLSFILHLLASKVKNKSSYYLLLGFTALCAFFLLTELKEPIIKFVISVSPSERLSMRLVMLIDKDNVAASSSSFDGRMDLFMMSFNTWTSNFRNFIFGVGDHRVLYDIDINGKGIGQHSEFIDSAARYGIIGVTILIAILVKTFKFLFSYFGSEHRVHIIAVLIIIILCGLTKHLFLPELGFPILILLPLLKPFLKISYDR